MANVTNDNVEVIHAEQAQFDYPGLLNWIMKLDKRWKPDVILLEAIGAGTGLYHHLWEYQVEHVNTIGSHA